MMRSFRVLAIVACLGLGIRDCLGAPETSKYSRGEVLSWLDGKDGFYFSDKLSQRDGRIVVNRNVEADEVVMEIPRSAILAAESDSGDGNTFCMLYNALTQELDKEEASKYAPYLRQIQEEQATDIMLPSLWSNTGKRLLELVSTTYPMNKITSVLEDYSHCIDGIRKEKKIKTEAVRTDFGTYDGEMHEHQAVEETEEEKTRNLNLALAVKHQIDQKYMIPLYDQLEHHHVNFNANYQVLEDNSVRIVAVRSIATGESLSRPSTGCLEDCDDMGRANFIETFKNYGEVQSYPHMLNFSLGISLIYHGTHEGETASDPTEFGKIEWIQPPKYQRQIAMLAEEYRLQGTSYMDEVLPSRESVDEREWQQINKYCHSLFDILEGIIVEGSKLDLISEEDEDEESEDSESEDEDSEDDEGNEGNDNDIEDHVDAKIRGKAQEVASRIEAEEKAAKKARNSTEGYPWMVKGCDLSEHCDLEEISESRECGEEYNFNAYRNETEWALMRSAYIAVVGPQQASFNLTYGSGFKVPFKIAHSPGRGRGVFATEDIPKGTLVWSSDFTATFTEGIQFRKFLSVLPDDMVCDLIVWCYTSLGIGKRNVIECDLDEGSLVNSYDDISEYNIGNKNTTYDTTAPDNVFAVRDIKAGEELVTAYDEFDTENYGAFGL